MRFTYAEAMTDPATTSRWRRPRRRRLRRVPRPRQHLLPGRVRGDLPVHRRRRPGLHRGQAVPRAVLDHPGDGRGHRAHPLRDLGAQAHRAPPGARRQAGRVHRRADERPPHARRRHQPVAGGLRGVRRPVRAARASGPTRASPSCAGCSPATGSSTTARSTTSRASSSARCRPRPIPIIVGGHAEPALRRAARNDGWIHGGGDLEALPGLIARLHELRAEEGRASDPFEVHVISMDAYTARRDPAPRGARRHRRDRRLPLDLRQGPGHRDPADQGRPPQPLRRHHVLTASVCAQHRMAVTGAHRTSVDRDQVATGPWTIDVMATKWQTTAATTSTCHTSW